MDEIIYGIIIIFYSERLVITYEHDNLKNAVEL